MPTFYFDTKNGVPVRDRTGRILATACAAIDYSKRVALALLAESSQCVDGSQADAPRSPQAALYGLVSLAAGRNAE